MDDSNQIENTTVSDEIEYRYFFESGLNGMLVILPHSDTVIAANPAACSMLGMTEMEICNLDKYGLFDLSNPAVQKFLEEKRHKRKVIAEVTLVRKDGTTFPALASSVIFRDDEGSEKNYFIFRDNTDSKKAELEKETAFKKYRSLVNTIDGIVWEADAKTFQFSFISRQAESILGYPAERWLNEPTFWKDHIHPQDREAAVAYCTQCTREKKSHQIEYRMIHADGKPIWIQDIISVIIENDQPVLLRGIMMDISERKISEQKLGQSELHYRSFFQQNLAGVYQSTLKGFILNCNNAIVNMLGYNSCEELMAVNAINFYFSHEDREQFIAKLREHKKLYNYERILKRKDGTPLYVIENIFLRTDEVTGEEFCDAVIIDITQRKLAELATKAINLKYQAVIDNPMLAYFLSDKSGNIIDTNNAASEMFGYTKAEFLKLNRSDFLDVKDPKFIQAISHRKQTGRAGAEINGIIKSGKLFPVGFISSTFLDADGEEKNSSLLLDLTLRKKAEEKVLLSEQRFKSLVQNGSDLLGILDAEGNYLYVSPTSKKVLGIPPESLVGKNAFSFIHEDDLEKTKESMAMLAHQDCVDVPLFRFKNIEGEWRWIECTLTNLMNDPAVGGIVANSRDVTEKKINDDELQKLSLIAKETINGVIITDENEKIVWINDAFTKLSGYKLAEVFGLRPVDFLLGEERDQEIDQYIQTQRAQKIPFTFETANIGKNGNKFFVRVQVQPIFNSEGEIKQYFALQTDITKEKHLTEEVAIEKIIRQKEITEAVISAQENERSQIGREMHDNVNQLLAASKMYIDMARVSKEKTDSLLASAINYTITAIEEIRKLSKTLITPSIKEMGLKESIKDLANDIMHVNPLKIEFHTKDFDEEILTEKFKLNIFRIVQETINNTLKHANATTIQISLAQTKNNLYVTVSDNGNGYDTSAKKKGIGILNIISRAELYKGDVQINAAPGKGCLLFISFTKTNLLLGNAT